LTISDTGITQCACMSMTLTRRPPTITCRRSGRSCGAANAGALPPQHNVYMLVVPPTTALTKSLRSSTFTPFDAYGRQLLGDPLSTACQCKTANQPSNQLSIGRNHFSGSLVRIPPKNCSSRSLALHERHVAGTKQRVISSAAAKAGPIRESFIASSVR